jgi:hypothetical protein
VAVIIVHQGSGLTQETYEGAVRRVSGKDRVESPSDWPVEGLLSHAAGQGPNGFRVVDVWESEEAARKFGEKLVPIMQELNISAEPEVYPAHTFVTAQTLVTA